MTAFYNEIDPYAAQWLRNLIDAGHIAPGVVDTRSIEDIAPDELRDYTQVHFFAGIGVWSYALRLAGWPDNRPVWTGSCPCQPFSAAGKGAGVDDPRHLWPHFHWLIKQCKPETVFGEQVASKDGLAWLDDVHADLEGTGYASAALDLCAAGVGAPHIRQRLYWMAHRTGEFQQGSRSSGARGWNEPSDGSSAIWLGDTAGERCKGQRLQHIERSADPEASRAGEVIRMVDNESTGRREGGEKCGGSGKGSHPQGVEQRAWSSGACCGMAHDESEQCEQQPGRRETGIRQEITSGIDCASGGLEHPGSDGQQGWLFGWEDSERKTLYRQAGRNRSANTALQVNGFWRDADWLFCRDGVWRPVEPGTFPLVDGATARVGRLRAYGNAIVAPLAQAFIEAAAAAIQEVIP